MRKEATRPITLKVMLESYILSGFCLFLIATCYSQPGTHTISFSSFSLWLVFHSFCLLLSAACSCQFLISSQDLKIMVWDLISSSLNATLSGHYSPPTAIQLLDKWTVVSAAADKVLIVWDLRKNEKIKAIPIYEEINCLLAISTSSLSLPPSTTQKLSSTVLLSGGKDGKVKLWDPLSAIKRTDFSCEVYSPEGREAFFSAGSEIGALFFTIFSWFMQTTYFCSNARFPCFLQWTVNNLFCLLHSLWCLLKEKARGDWWLGG